MNKITIHGFAKLNLFLDIVGALPDGYHSLRGVMQEIDLADELEISLCSENKITLTCDEPLVPLNEKNIAFKAAQAYLSEISSDCGVQIFIKKKIPVMAGLGGSSADGAAVLVGLNRLLMGVSEARLLEIGRSLGADVPFLMRGGTRICEGAGEIMRELTPLADCVFLIVVPDFGCDTRAAFRLYDQKPVAENRGFHEFLSLLDSPRSFAPKMYNIFEKLYNNQKIFSIKNQLLQAGALGASLTGSGSAVFGVFENAKDAENAQKKISYERKIFAILPKRVEIF